MCEKYYEIIEAIEDSRIRTCEYQEAYHECVDDLTKHIFLILGLCPECGQRVFGRGN